MRFIQYIWSFVLIIMVPTTTCAAAKPAKSEAVFHKIVKEYTLKADGSAETRYTKELTLHSFPSMNSMYGETFIIYNPNYQKIKFDEAITTQVDGTVIPVPANAFNEVLLSAAANAPAYNDVREMVVTHTGLEIGARILLSYTIHSTPAGPKYLDIAEILQEISPVEQYIVKVTVPDNTSANYSFTGGSAKPVITSASGMTTYTWAFQQVPAASREPFQPAVAGYRPCLTFTTLPSQEAVLKQLKENVAGMKKDFSAITVADKTKELIKNADNRQDKIKSIQQFLASGIDNNSLTLSETGGRIRTPQEVLETAYGTAAEKTLLMKQMLDAAGIKSDLTVLYPAGLIENAIVGLAAVRGMGLTVEYDSVKCFLPSNSAVQKPLRELAYNHSIACLSGNDFSIIKQEIEKTKIDYFADTLNVTTIQSYGSLNSKVTTAQEVKPSPAVWPENGYRKIILGSHKLKGVDSFGMNSLTSERKSPLSIPYPIEETVTNVVYLDKESELVTLPSEIQISNKAGKLDLSVRQEGLKITVSRHIDFNQSVFSPAEYSDFFKIMQEWNNPNFHTIVVRKK